MTQHAKTELTTGTWKLLGWWKAATTKEGAVHSPRVHIVNLEKNQAVAQFVAPAPAPAAAPAANGNAVGDANAPAADGNAGQ